jgi:hypothetical protein
MVISPTEKIHQYFRSSTNESWLQSKTTLITVKHFILNYQTKQPSSRKMKISLKNTDETNQVDACFKQRTDTIKKHK